VSIVSETNSGVGGTSRRRFLQGMGVMGGALLNHNAWSVVIADSTRRSAARAGKNITLVNGFESLAWGWQFTKGARVVDSVRHRDRQTVQITTESGAYARFLVLGPEPGKTYTLSGWAKTDAIVQEEDDAGAYFTASQFEFQGRPTEFTVDGKQLPERRFGNFTGTNGWHRFSQSFTCLPSTTWFEIVIGIYRAEGSAWFSDLTFVEGNAPADFDEVVDVWKALQWVHEETIRKGNRNRPAAAILNDSLPVRGAASDPKHLASILRANYDTIFLGVEQLADPSQLNRTKFDLLVLPYGESFPLSAFETVVAFLEDGGDLLSTGGYAFQSPLANKTGKWEFYDEAVQQERGPNLLPVITSKSTDWKTSGSEYATTDDEVLPEAGSQQAAKIEIPADIWGQESAWYYELPAQGDGVQFFFEGWIRASDVRPSPQGSGYIGIEQLDEKGNQAYAGSLIFEELRGSHDWHKVEKLISLVPTCRKLRVGFGLKSATGTLWGSLFKLEKRSPQVRINTALGFPQDELQVNQRQIGMFDADFRLKRIATIRGAKGQYVIPDAGEVTGSFDGYAATCVIGMNNSRWIPLLEAYDDLGRKRGAAGALVYHTRAAYARGSWAYFGVENHDMFSAQNAFGAKVLSAVSHAQIRKCFLHACEADFASYREGEPVHVRVLASNFGRQRTLLELRWRITPTDSDQELHQLSRHFELTPGQTLPLECRWHATSFPDDRYRITVRLFLGEQEIDQVETGFIIWKAETLRKGLDFQFKDNYFQVHNKSLFLQGTDDYLHTFVDQDENPLTWYDDVQGCRDACIDVYENLMGLRGPQHRPTETWWRWIDAMLLNVQHVGGAFFPGMLIFSNTAVSDKDLADQQAYVQAFATRYKDAAGLMYYLNGDLELHDPNLPDLQKRYNQYIQQKYGSDESLRKAWVITPPEMPIGELTIRSGRDEWCDVRTLDDFEFRTQVVRQWLNTMHDSIRKVDQHHPVTAEFYQLPVAGIDLVTAVGDLELANFGYFDSPGEDYYRFPQVCKFLDQGVRGKGITVGEFGVKTHPAWLASSDYIAARTEKYEQAYFLAIAHYSFALGASKIQNWCWKYPSDLPFEWGINYSNELIPRDVLTFYRNTGLLFRQLRPRYEASEVLVLLAGENRKGGKGPQILEGILNGIRLLIDQRVRFSTLADDFFELIPENVKTIFYPLPYCPSDAIVERLSRFVDQGGQLYISGDLTYDSWRQRTRNQRLKSLCGLEFVSERYPNIEYEHFALKTSPTDPTWPEYLAAPGLVTRLAGAKSLLNAVDGIPIVTEFQRGKGKVIFSADPVELHGDPRYQPYAHAFYGAILQRFGVSGETILPTDAPVHRFQVPSQDDRTIDVLVNYDETHTARFVTLPTSAGDVRIVLAPRMSGAVVAESVKGVQAVESSGDVFVKDQLVVGSDLHLMFISLGRQSLLNGKCLLLLPMGQGEIRIPEAGRWRREIVLVGEVKGRSWQQHESFQPQIQDGMLRIPIHAGRALSMLIVCESDEQQEATRLIEVIVNSPWDT
jgi:hypothetical protein